jgi:hypothetical protein
MFAAYVIVALVAANTWAASGLPPRRDGGCQRSQGRCPPSWLLPLGALKLAGAVGLIADIAVPLIGVAAAIGLVLFFVCAIFAYPRVGWYSTLPFPAAFLLMRVNALGPSPCVHRWRPTPPALERNQRHERPRPHGHQ